MALAMPGVGMIFGRVLRRWFLGGIVFALGTAVSAAPEQFDIPAQPLPAALKAFASQAHVQLLYIYNVVADGHGNAVRGPLDARKALEKLLRGTGFEAAYSSDTEITIRRTRSPAQFDPAVGSRSARSKAQTEKTHVR